MSSIRTAPLTTDGTTVGEVTKLEVTEGDLRSGDEGVTDVVVEGDLSSREEGGLEIGRGARVSAKVTGGPTVSSLGLPRPRIILVGELPLLALGKLTATLKWLVNPGASVVLLLLTRADLKPGLRFTEPDS